MAVMADAHITGPLGRAEAGSVFGVFKATVSQVTSVPKSVMGQAEAKRRKVGPQPRLAKP
jgi:hypothetical protein